MRKITVTIVDDIDDTTEGETFAFGFNDQGYEIDLNPRHTKTLRSALAHYAEHGRKISATARTARGSTRASSAKAKRTEANTAVRNWARSRGLPVNERGRIPAVIQAQYDAAH